MRRRRPHGLGRAQHAPACSMRLAAASMRDAGPWHRQHLAGTRCRHGQGRPPRPARMQTAPLDRPACACWAPSGGRRRCSPRRASAGSVRPRRAARRAWSNPPLPRPWRSLPGHWWRCRGPPRPSSRDAAAAAPASWLATAARGGRGHRGSRQVPQRWDGTAASSSGVCALSPSAFRRAEGTSNRVKWPGGGCAVCRAGTRCPPAVDVDADGHQQTAYCFQGADLKRQPADGTAFVDWPGNQVTLVSVASHSIPLRTGDRPAFSRAGRPRGAGVACTNRGRVHPACAALQGDRTRGSHSAT